MASRRVPRAPALRNANVRLNLAVDTSADGRWLSLTTETPEGRRQAALYDVRSDRMTLLHDDAWEQRAGRFSPDGGSVLFVSNVDGRDIVYRYDVASGRADELPLPAGVNADFFGKLPAFTPDGKQVVFPHESGTQTIDYWSLDLESRKVTQVTRLGLASMGSDILPATQIVHYRSADGTVISALLWIPFNAPRAGISAAVVLAHGEASDQQGPDSRSLRRQRSRVGIAWLFPSLRRIRAVRPVTVVRSRRLTAGTSGVVTCRITSLARGSWLTRDMSMRPGSASPAPPTAAS